MQKDIVRLYTRQNEKTLFMLEREGRIRNSRIHVQLHFGDMAHHYLSCYDWFVQEAARHVPKPSGVELPIWCALRPESCLLPIEGTVIYVLDVPREQVVYFDDVKWDYVLNHRYLPADAADDAAYRERLKSLGISTPYAFFSGRYAGQYPQEERRVRESWRRVFETPDPNAPSTSANIWEIRQEQLRRIVRPGEAIA